MATEDQTLEAELDILCATAEEEAATEEETMSDEGATTDDEGAAEDETSTKDAATLWERVVEDKLLEDVRAEFCERVEEIALLTPEHVPKPDWQPREALQ